MASPSNAGRSFPADCDYCLRCRQPQSIIESNFGGDDYPTLLLLRTCEDRDPSCVGDEPTANAFHPDPPALTAQETCALFARFLV